MTSDSKPSTLFGDSLIWFGAAVSIAEILTGTLFAPLGIWRGLAAILVGHAIGCVLLYGAGLVCANSGLCAMASVKLTFGDRGGRLFATLNLLQLVGWTAVMIASGAAAANGILHLGCCAGWLWQCLIGALILVWLLLKVTSLQKTNLATMILLFGLSLLLSRLIFFGGDAPAAMASEGAALSFGDALELSIAMPVSWLPLIGDYTRNARRPRLSCLCSAGVYFVVSCWMYAIGMGAAIYAGESDIALIMTKAGLGAAAMVIVVLSTVTTTFLDVFSAGVSAASIWRRLPERHAAVAVCILGTIMAIVCDTASFESFLYWIGSVFVPMATVQLMDMLLLKRPFGDDRWRKNLVSWLIGFAAYRLFLALGLPCGSTIPDIIITAIICRLWR